MVGSWQVRLFGAHAPEFSQSCQRNGQAWACGKAAADELGRPVKGQQVRCMSTGIDQHQRLLGRCSVGSEDIDRAMVAKGYAVAYRLYSTGYVSAEDSANTNKRELWAGTFQMPNDYRYVGTSTAPRSKSSSARREHSVSTSRSSKPHAGGCNVEGNQSRRGERIYHLPGMPNYAPTRAKQMFCSEAEARAADYRRAIVR